MTRGEPKRSEEEPFAGIGKGDNPWERPPVSLRDVIRKAVAVFICIIGGIAICAGWLFAGYWRIDNLTELGWAVGTILFGMAAAVYDGMVF